MENINRGKQFEDVVKKSFLKVDGVSIDRLHDQTNGFLNSANICDFIVYKEPYEYYIECKSVHGNVLSFKNITDTQWNGLLEKSKIKGVKAGVICWWVDKDITRFIPIKLLEVLKTEGHKSIRYDYGHRFPASMRNWGQYSTIKINGKKKRVFFDYDMEEFLNNVNYFGRD